MRKLRVPGQLVQCVPILLLVFIVCVSISAGEMFTRRPQDRKVDESASASTGKKIFSSTCAGCHGLDGRGTDRGANIATKPEVRRMSDDAIYRTIHDGSASNRMPAFGDSLDSAKLRALVKYVRALQGERQGEALPGNAVSGKSLFFGKAGCSECHMVNGTGGFIGADLSNYGRGRPAEEIRKAILNPNANATRKPRMVSVVTGGGEKFTGIARNEDNFSLQVQTPDGAFHLLMKSELEKVEYQQQSLMPSDYGERLNASELNDLISFIEASAQERHPPATTGNHPAAKAK